MGNVSEEDRAYITELVKRAQKNDSNAFAELYTMTYETEYAFSRKYMRDDDYAQDVLQEVYTWLRQINFRICYDMAIKRKQQSVSGYQGLETVIDNHASGNPEEAMMIRAAHEELEKALKKLPVKERNAIVLKWMANMSLNDIACHMNCSISSVTRYLSRGYKGLRKMLETS